MITEAHFLSGDLVAATTGSRDLDKQIADFFGLTFVEPWSRDFETAVDLFQKEFPDWSRNCLSNSCQGIYWYIDHDDEELDYGAVAATDCLALCAAMVKAKGKVSAP
jgi:hypothetical protein